MSDTAKWLATLIGGLSTSLAVPTMIAVVDPILEMEKAWWALEDEYDRLSATFDAIRDSVGTRHPGGGRKQGLRGADKKKLTQLNLELEHLVERQTDILDRMVETDATTVTGIYAKLRIINGGTDGRDWQPAPLPDLTIRFINDSIRVLADAPL